MAEAEPGERGDLLSQRAVLAVELYDPLGHDRLLAEQLPDVVGEAL